MIRSSAFFNINDNDSGLKLLIEKEPVKIYTDFKDGDGNYICYPVRHCGYRVRGLPTEFDLMYKDARAEFDGNIKPYQTVKHDLRFEGIKDILRRNLEERRARDSEFASKLGGFDFEEFCESKNKSELANIHARKKRFLRKCAFNRDKLNWFGTITWDSSIHKTADDWVGTLLRWLGNNAYRYGAKFMGAFEYGEDNGRIHFHCVASLPDDFFTDLHTVHRFSEKERCWMNFLESAELREKFGMNEWERLGGMAEDSFIRTLKYVCKYATKDGGRMYYSRGLPDCTYQKIDAEDLFFVFDDGVVKYKLRDGFRINADTLIGVLRQSGAKRLADSDAPFRER